MYFCVACKFEVVLDDVEILHTDGHRCICLRCYLREVGAPASQIAKGIRRAINSIEEGA